MVDALLRYKWRRFGALTYFTNLIVYMLFLGFLTSYIVLNEFVDTQVNSFSRVAEVFVVVFSGLRIIMEIFQMFHEKGSYFMQPINAVEWFTFAFALGFILPFSANKSDAQWTAGAFSIFFAW